MSDKHLRALAHMNLVYWAETREAALEGLGSAGHSVTERMRQRAHGGGSSTRPNQLTGPERQAGGHDRTLRVEQAVRALPDQQRSVLRWKYLAGEPVAAWALANGLPQRTAADAVNRAMLAVGRDVTFGNRRRAAARRAADRLADEQQGWAKANS